MQDGLLELLVNAIEHGNLEMSSELRESAGDEYRQVRLSRTTSAPYADRRVQLQIQLTSDELKVVVKDEGPGFDPSTLPDPTDAENLLKPSGRGLLLIRTFMDQVSFNETGNEVTMQKRSKSNPETTE